MERELPRLSHPGLNGSALVGLLSELALIEAPASTPSFVEGLGRWLGWEDAIALSAVLPMPQKAAEAAARAAPKRAAACPTQVLVREFARVQAALGRAIDDAGRAQPDDTDLDFLPFRRRYTGLQQAMEAAMGPLRAQARAAVARMSPAGARLAALDQALDQALAAREQALLGLMPALLERRFQRLCPGADGLAVFRQDLKRLASAELELRLQTAQGLLDTLRTKEPELHE